MKKKLVICGDSFGYGIGCVNLDISPFGVLTANKLVQKIKELGIV